MKKRIKYAKKSHEGKNSTTGSLTSAILLLILTLHIIS
jgi:hypothetical protein